MRTVCGSVASALHWLYALRIKLLRPEGALTPQTKQRRVADMNRAVDIMRPRSHNERRGAGRNASPAGFHGAATSSAGLSDRVFVTLHADNVETSTVAVAQ